MNTVDQLKDLLNWRYACKEFDKEAKLSADKKDVLLSSLHLAPSSFGMQLWKFFIVETQETKEKLKAVSWNQGQVADADFYVVFSVETGWGEERVDKWMECLAEARNVEADSLAGYKGAIMGFISQMSDEDKVNWAKKQAYIALGQLMTSAALLKVDTCPMEGIDPKAYDEILGLPEKGYTTAVGCAVGYRSANDKYVDVPKTRFSFEEMVEVI